MVTFLTTLVGIILAVISFIAGKTFSESSKILEEKRRVYEEFLRCLPSPNDAYSTLSDTEELERTSAISEAYKPFLLYASPGAALAAGRYLSFFENAATRLDKDSAALDPAFKVAAKAHNDLILEMRRDCFVFSYFSYHGKSRLEPAKNEEVSGLD